MQPYINPAKNLKSDHELFSYSVEHLLTAAFNSTESVRFMVSENGTILHFNRKAYENSQLLHNKLLKRGDNLFDYADEPTNDVTNGLKACLKRCFKGETFFSEAEVKYGTEVRWFKSEYVPVFDQFKIIAASIHIHEITQQKLQEQAKDKLLSDIEKLHLEFLNEGKGFADLAIKHSEDGLTALKTRPKSEIRVFLLDLISIAWEFKSKITHWKGRH